MLKTRGLRHLALRVRDVERSKQFYMKVFGMMLVWQPDPDNAYLSSGPDNLALHREPMLPGDNTRDDTKDRLDHLGFIVADLDELERNYAAAQRESLDIAHPLKRHRDGSSSFYIRDPDGIIIQLLYEPAISPLDIR